MTGPPVPLRTPAASALHAEALEPRTARAMLALRVLARLPSLPRDEEGFTGLAGATQEGLAASLSVTQGAISKILTRLERAELVRVRLVHVAGRLRRVRTYRLTSAGEQIARRAASLPALSPTGDPGPGVETVSAVPGRSRA